MALGAMTPAGRWTHYRNERWNFCAAYPAGWKRTPAASQSGIQLNPFGLRPPPRDTYVAIGALPNQPSDAEPTRLQTAEEIFDTDLKELKTDGAEDITVLEKRRCTLQGFPALITRVRYRAGNSGLWQIEKTYRITSFDGVVYAVELKCLPEELSTLEPILDRMVQKSFRIGCTKEANDKTYPESKEGPG
jgi:hypothetical protein